MKPLTENEKMLLRQRNANVVQLLKEFQHDRPHDDRTTIFLVMRTYMDGLKGRAVGQMKLFYFVVDVAHDLGNPQIYTVKANTSAEANRKLLSSLDYELNGETPDDEQMFDPTEEYSITEVVPKQVLKVKSR